MQPEDPTQTAAPLTLTMLAQWADAAANGFDDIGLSSVLRSNISMGFGSIITNPDYADIVVEEGLQFPPFPPIRINTDPFRRLKVAFERAKAEMSGVWVRLGAIERGIVQGIIDSLKQAIPLP